MNHVRFQHNVSEGGIEVQFKILGISIHSNFLNSLPRHPDLTYFDGEWLLMSTHKKQKEGQLVERYEYHTDALSKDLVRLILQHKEEQTPKF